MAEDKKISRLDRLDKITDTALIPVVANGDNYAAQAQTLRNYVIGDVNLTTLKNSAENAWFECLARQFEALAGKRGTVNRQKQTFALHGIDEISADEMFKIIAAPWNSGQSFYNPLVRTATIVRGLSAMNAKTLEYVFCTNSVIETIENIYTQAGTLNNCFRDCPKLRAISAVTDPILATWVADFSTCFRKLPKLEYLGIFIGNCTGLSLEDSPLITMQCLSDIVTRARNTRPISITVHPDVYAKLAGDTTNEVVASMSATELQEWKNVLAAADAKNIVLLPPCKRLSFYGGIKVLSPVECTNIPIYGHRENWHNWLKDDNVSVGDTVLIDIQNAGTQEYGYAVARLMGIYDETGGYNTPHYINTFSLHGAMVKAPGTASAANELAADISESAIGVPMTNERLALSSDHEPTDEDGNITTD